jgi:hypothetical protein
MTQDQGWEGSPHYTELNVQPWEAMDSWMTPREFIGFLKGCAIKRLARTHSKGEERMDLIKSIHELRKALEILEEFVPEPKYLAADFTWANNLLKEGRKMRRIPWDPGAYLCLATNDKTNHQYYRTEAGVPYALTQDDREAKDWEVYD